MVSLVIICFLSPFMTNLLEVFFFPSATHFILRLVIVSVISSLLSGFYLATSFRPSHLLTPSGVRLENRWEDAGGEFCFHKRVQSLSTGLPLKIFLFRKGLGEIITFRAKETFST